MGTPRRLTSKALAFAILVGGATFGLLGCDVGTYGEVIDDPPMGGVDGGGAVPLTFTGQISQDLGACLACHGAGLQEGGYRVDTYNDTIAAVVPNDPDSSLLVTEMNPDGPPRTEHAGVATAIRFQLYTDWVNAGAPE